MKRNLEEQLHQAIVSRRGFLHSLGAAGLSLGLSQLASAVVPTNPRNAPFVFSRLKYEGGDWNADMLTEGLMNGSEVNLLAKINEVTRFDAYPQEHSVWCRSEEVFNHPFLYATGHGGCDFTEPGRQNIRLILERGGFLLMDNCSGAKKAGFDRSARTQIQLMFPDKKLRKLPQDHPIFSSYYQIDQVLGGDKRMDQFLEGMDVHGRTAVVYTRNDLGCAWEGHPCHPGGETQRRHAFELGINLIFYALSGI